MGTEPWGTRRLYLGTYHHAAPPDLAPYITSTEVKATFSREVEAFIDGYAAKSLLWLARIP